MFWPQHYSDSPSEMKTFSPGTGIASRRYFWAVSPLWGLPPLKEEAAIKLASRSRCIPQPIISFHHQLKSCSHLSFQISPGIIQAFAGTPSLLNVFLTQILLIFSLPQVSVLKLLPNKCLACIILYPRKPI